MHNSLSRGVASGSAAGQGGVCTAKAFYGHLAAALAAVAAFHCLWREVTYKLADQVTVYADCAGFAEAASERPLGAVDWVMRILAATNLAWWGILVQLALLAAASAVAYFALRRRGSALAPFAPWFAAAIFVLPALSLGEDVWMLRHPHFPQMHLAWFAVLAACLFAGWKGLLVFAAIPVAVVGAGRFFYYDLAGDENLWSACHLPIMRTWTLSASIAVAVLVLFAASAFVRRGLPRWAHAAAPALFALASALALPARDTRGQLRMERAVLDGRFADVLSVAPEKPGPERMETAWRILAMFRLGTIDRDLHRYPICGSHLDTKEEEMVMEGPLMYFNYGMILTARRWIFESVMCKGWRPLYFRLLGDGALVMGERELARKNFRQLARCPFRGEFAGRRLKALDADPIPDNAFADLADVSGFHRVWQHFEATSDGWRFVSDDLGVERAVYAQFLQLRDCPPQMLKMVFAAAILNGRPELLRQNPRAMKVLYPNGNVGPAFLEALRK